jgi:hypothetical protein
MTHHGAPMLGLTPPFCAHSSLSATWVQAQVGKLIALMGIPV